VNVQVCVVGGGPAGASVARRLAMLGHSVVVIEKSPFPRPHVGESLTGGVLPLLDVLQLRNDVEREGFLRTSRALIRWAGAAEVRDTAGAAGFQVDRSRFDELLIRAAQSAGAMILQPARIVDCARSPGGRWAIVARHADGYTIRVDCDFLIDATGRTSALGSRRSVTQAHTIALCAYWRNAGIQGPETRVEAGPAEWFWGAPLPDGLFNATVFVGTGRLRQDSIPGQSIEALYYRLIASSELLRACLSGTRAGPVQVCDATCGSAAEPIRDDLIKVGESAFTIDPLSSQGVQTAIGSALHAAAVVHTLRERPANRRLAEDFYRQRHRRSVALHRDAAARLYAAAAETYQTGFWMRRSPAETSRNESANRTPPVELSPDTVLRLNPRVQFREVPIIEDAFVTAATAAMLPQMPEPLVFVDGVKVTPLIRMLDRPMRCDQILASWKPSAGPRTALRILRLALGNCLLILNANVPDAHA
jgi:flavin-dependent dehydrogenase